MDEGIVSPGGVGYDINCITGDSKILDEFGRFTLLREFENQCNETEVSSGNLLLKKLSNVRLSTLNLHSKLAEPKNATFFMSKGIADVYELTLQSGLRIKSTLDHPFLTKSGMKEARSLLNEEVAVKNFEGIAKDNSPRKALILARLIGYHFGDGTLYFSGKISKKKGYVCFYGQKEDLEEISKDIKSLGFSARLYSRTRSHSIKTKYASNSFTANHFELHVKSLEFAYIFKALGVPEGNKTRTAYSIPEWIKNGTLSIKQQFLAGFFGAELSSPKNSSKTGFMCHTVSQNKIEPLCETAREFLGQVEKLLLDFGIKSGKISESEEFVNKQGEKTYRMSLLISATESNLLTLWKTIGFAYNQKRKNLAEIASLYIMLKKQETEKRTKIAKELKNLRKQGITLAEIKTRYSGSINERFLERHYYENASQRISLNFISFENFKKQKLAEFEQYGAIFDKVESMAYAGNETVYDFNVEDNHNFVANSFIVSNCGVRVIRTDWTEEEIRPKLRELLDELFRQIPSGVGRGGQLNLTKDQLREILVNGSGWALDNGYATKDDLNRTEEYGHMKNADPDLVSNTAFSRGKEQVGTLGAGNHFLEIQKVGSINNEKTANAFGIEKEGQVVVMVHCGSRGLGHQIASDYIKAMEDKFGYADLPDRELINAPINSDMGQKYIKAMNAGMNFAFTNRQLITHWIRNSFRKVMGSDEGMKMLYDVCHNGAKIEKHRVDGENRTVCIHRKGATRAFGPGREELPEVYQKTGQPVLIPGSMGTASYILVGTEKGEEVSFGSTAHGAGRAMSRSAALKLFRGEEVVRDMEKHGILVKGASWKGVAEEAAEAYKDIDEVAKVSDSAGIGKTVVRLLPLGVVKG